MGKGPKSGTESEFKEHRFVSFREKVDSIKIDPVRKTRRKDHLEDSENSSYFVKAFDNWSELNVSTSFSDFVEECAPYCQSFPQVIYHKEKIILLLEQYIKLEDEFSLESLLDLVTHFAHDLGPDFEPYFHRTLLLLVQLASNSNISIVEWTFTCFAYLFKYLSRLLTVNLKPTYDVLAPILGKSQHQKRHVTRFTAESLSFLVRKSTGDSLTDIVNHIVCDVVSTRKPQFFRACIELFNNSMASSGNNLYSRTPSIITAILASCSEQRQEDQVYATDFTCGIIASLLHHTRQDTSSLLYGAILDFIQQNNQNNTLLCTRSLYVLAGLRQGSRVNDWIPIYQNAIRLLDNLNEVATEFSNKNLTLKSSMEMTVSILQNSDFKSSSSQHRKLLDGAYALYSKHDLFLAFANILINQGKTAFKEFMKGYIEKYFKTQWKGNELQLSLFLIHANNSGMVNSETGLEFSTPLNLDSSAPAFCESIKSHVIRSLNEKEFASEDNLLRLWCCIDLYKIILSANPIKGSLQKLLSKLMSTHVENDLKSLKNALIGRVLSLLATQESQGLLKVISMLHDYLVDLRHSGIFLQGYLDVLSKIKSNNETIQRDIYEEILDRLKDGVRSPSSAIRSLTLKICSTIYELNGGSEIPRVISTCELIEQIPIDVSTSRDLSLRIRNIGMQYNSTGDNVLVDKLVPGYLFGLLTIRFKPVWDAVAETVEKIAPKASQEIWNLSWEWLAYDKSEGFGLFADLEEVPTLFKVFENSTTVFCTNLNGISDETANTVERYFKVQDTLKTETKNLLQPDELPSYLRTKTLEVLLKVPTIAENNSKYLVPYLLRDDDDDIVMDTKALLSSAWSQDDRIALLDIFGMFKKPKSLYRSNDVYQRYLYLLGSKILKVQQKALKCVLTFKDPQVRKYSDNLNNLLDDTQFKDELTNFVRRSGEEEGTIHEEDRDAVLPLVMRILFGRGQVAKTGGVKQGRRFAVIHALNNVEPKFLRLFVSLASESLESGGFLKESDGIYTIDRGHAALSMSDQYLRREHGFVTMLEDILKQLKGKAEVAIDVIMEPLLFALCHSQSLSQKKMDAENDGNNTEKSIKSIRNLGLKCLDIMFQEFETADWTKYFGPIYDNLITPRLPNFGPDNIGQASSLMKMMKTLTTSEDLAHLFSWDNFSIPKALFDCVNYDNVQDSVVELILGTMENIANLQPTNPDREGLIQTSAPILLNRMPFLFERENSSKHLIEIESNILVKLLPESVVSENIRQQLVKVAVTALDKSTNQVRIPVKATILKALTGLLDERCTEEEIMSIYRHLSKLFKQFSDRNIRINLAELYQSFGERSEKLARVGNLIVELNSFSTKRLELPDFNRRLAAFSTINEKVYNDLSSTEWLPILYNMLFFIRDPEELALRTGAAYSLRRFIDSISLKKTEEEVQPYIELLDEVILPNLKIGLRDTTELFRFEFIAILGHLVKYSQWYHELDDMKCLLFDGDEEANFFNNIGHVQIHRRQRAIKRLGGFASQKALRDTSIAYYLLPIIEHYVSDLSGDAHNVSLEAIKAIGILVRHLSWNQYRAITKRYVGYLNTRKEYTKVNIKLIDTVADALSEPDAQMNDEEGDTEMNGDSNEGKGVRLLDNLPGNDKFSSFITEDIIPKMQAVLKSNNQEDDESLTNRIPLAIPIVKFIRVLPDGLLEAKLPGVLTGFCQILRAKSQELRDMIRRSLGTIARILGARYLVFIIRELKGALRRGTQLHVLGYSIHYLLTEMKEKLNHGDLDDSVSLISEIMMEDIFGVTGSEKDEEDFRTQMKEVKHGKSYDNGNILSTNISLGKFSSLIEPIKSILLYEKLSAKVEGKIETLLSRIAEGLYHNDEASDQRVLIMCHELLRMIEDTENEEMEKRRAADDLNKNYRERQQKEVEDHFTVVLDSRHWGEYSGQLHIDNLHVLKRFILDALRRVLGRNETSLMTTENIMGFIPSIESGLYSNYEGVQISALRLLTLILKLKLPKSVMEDKYKSYGRRSLALIKQCSETNSEMCQANLRMLSTLIRQKEEFNMKESALAYVLQRIKPDLEEPNKQGITFTFIKSVLSRKIIMSEVYDVMDRMAQVMVTNQSGVIREACRSAYFQFITEYPQGQGRLSKQLQFLTSNLSYTATSGRLSVMEMIHLLVTKVNSDQVESFSSTFFAALVLVLVKDTDTECRKTAAVVIGEIIQNAGDDQRKLIESYCTKWISNDEKPALVRGGMQSAGIYFTEISKGAVNKDLLKQAEDRIIDSMEKGKSDTEGSVDWQVLYASLQLFTKIVQSNPSRAFSTGSSRYKNIWELVENTLLYPHSWVRAVSTRLVGKLYSQCDENPDLMSEFDILKPERLQSTAFKLIRQLGATGVSNDDGVQIVRNLVFISRQWEAHGTLYKDPKRAVEDEEGEEEDGENEEDDTTRNDEQPALNWLVKKISSVLRNEKRSSEKAVSKRSAIQFLASVAQLVTTERLKELSFDLVMAFYPMSISEDDNYAEFKDLCGEALKLVQDHLGTTDYLEAYSNVREAVQARRVERKTKRSIQAVADPELHAKKKMKKHMQQKEKRKHLRDESGYYHGKKKNPTRK